MNSIDNSNDFSIPCLKMDAAGSRDVKIRWIAMSMYCGTYSPSLRRITSPRLHYL